ncbi:response regulator [Desulfosarcina ovata]|uniref:histidine kinase n=1 Tax=Desulfosarcina ovata subsp. ovata TaxID=2752305 RepID=A0A5K8AD24_9BACT|nr:response regulator [Desulfosarcina ovata]BBO90457.1 hybrid sensor histidine kinase/response regulator [Desulfosarcina ovata subsp. ovata]
MQSTPDPVTVLVIDDEKGIRDGSKRILDRMGCQTLTAENGEAGLATLGRSDASIVLLDLKMPGIDGIEVLKRIHTMNPEILVIIITGFATIETAIEAMKQGAYDFIPKPFEPDQLRIVVNRAWEKLSLKKEAAKLEKARRRTLADLGTERTRIHTIIDSLPNGIVVTNADGTVVLMNPAFVRVLELPADTATGQPISAYIEEEGLCRLIVEISSGRHVDFDDIPTYEFSAGEERFFMARGRPVLGERKECLGAVVTIVDITNMKVLDRLKSEFVAKVSHELRSPLSTIHEQLALVLNDLMGQLSESDEHLLSRAKEKTQGLISTIGDLLDLSRIESGITCQELKPVQLEELLGNIVDFLGTRARTKSQSLTLEHPDQPLPTIKADPLALESVFGNLIANAINYTQNGGEIVVRLDMTGINLRIRVIDNGFGIEERYLDKIFDRFFRVKTDKTRFITGTGLGLPIVKGLVESLKGRISVESAPEKGSTFTVLLPVD